MKVLSVESKFKLNGIEGYITEHEATQVVNGAYVEADGYDCWKREIIVSAMYSQSDIEEQEEYDQAPSLSEGESVKIDNNIYTLELKGKGDGFDFAVMLKNKIIEG